MHLACVHAGVGQHSIVLATGVLVCSSYPWCVLCLTGAGMFVSWHWCCWWHLCCVAIGLCIVVIGTDGIGVSVVLISSGVGVGGICTVGIGVFIPLLALGDVGCWWWCFSF